MSTYSKFSNPIKGKSHSFLKAFCNNSNKWHNSILCYFKNSFHSASLPSLSLSTLIKISTCCTVQNLFPSSFWKLVIISLILRSKNTHSFILCTAEHALFQAPLHFKDTTGPLPVCSSTGWTALHPGQPTLRKLRSGDRFREDSHLTIPLWLNSLYRQHDPCWILFLLAVWNVGEAGRGCHVASPSKSPRRWETSMLLQADSTRQVESRLVCNCMALGGSWVS